MGYKKSVWHSPGCCGSMDWVLAWEPKGTGSIPSQGTCLGCRPGPQLWVCERQRSMYLSRIDVSFPLFLPSFPLSLKVNKIFKKIISLSLSLGSRDWLLKKDLKMTDLRTETGFHSIIIKCGILWWFHHLTAPLNCFFLTSSFKPLGPRKRILKFHYFSAN